MMTSPVRKVRHLNSCTTLFDKESKMAYEYKLKKIIDFYETDAAGFVHFSNYFRFMEMAEHAFYRSIGFKVRSKEDSFDIGMPRVKVQCDFSQPLKLNDEVEIHLLVREKGERSISYEFIFRKVTDGCNPFEVARGSLTAVCTGFSNRGNIRHSIELPPKLNELIQEAPRELFGRSEG